MKRVLVLNQDYSPLTVCSVERAFLLLFLSKADMVHDAPGKVMRTVSAQYPMPSVIRLQKYIYSPFKSVVLSRQNIFKRDGQECQYCGSTKSLTLDHVIPKSRGGKSSWQNLVAACYKCNSMKGDKTPEEAGMLLKNRPFKPSYIMFVRNFSGLTSEQWLKYLSLN
ncbi:HNH endonuclease [Roseivirga seohaensis]|uniref:HNH endonuclease n=1 Tax=Roseivirga seohaensis TaxID=1914963 RepID=A0A150XLN2_9BACT|nr:HNH endonuclease [Roseivirga seohaensis]KYG79648.1 HNH endonuclease [Roseivirga seohaensis]